jgi:penicillin-binding protein 2
MFERRLKILLLFLALPVLIITVRLVQLQAFSGREYVQKAEDLLALPPEYLPCLRGKIVDRNGEPLAYNAPSWNIAVHYGMIKDGSPRPRILRQLGVKADNTLDLRIRRSWRNIARLADEPLEELQKQRAEISEKVERIKAYVEKRHGVEMEILEEHMFHTVVKGLDHEQHVRSVEALSRYPWVKVEASKTRRYKGGPAFGHILGWLNEVGPEDMAEDPQSEDKLARYQLNDLHGVAGLEALGEQWLDKEQARWLRGRRGRVHQDREGRPLSPRIEPVDGRDMRITIDRVLQQKAYDLVARAVDARKPTATGGSAVLVHTTTREVLAMVSYPSFDPNMPYGERLEWFKSKPFGKPHIFRSVGGNYPPGSVVKPLVLTAALEDQKAGSHESIYCRGYLLPGYPNKWRCLYPHGLTDPIEAIQRSCNVFFYTMGQRLGIGRLNYWMSQFGLGRKTGTELLEEKARPLDLGEGRGMARLAAIGQGRLTVTPVQLATMMATLATGRYEKVTLWSNDPRPEPPEELLPVDSYAWRIVRQGMHAVVNAQHGTAYRHIGDIDFGDYVLLGKTGSAETSRPSRPTHAWFAGYLTDEDDYTSSAENCQAGVAVAVVIEYGGHGGETAAPVAGDLVKAYMDRYWNRGTILSSGRQ